MMSAIKQFFMMFQHLFAAGSEASEALEKVARSGNRMADVYLLEQDHELDTKRRELAAKIRNLEAVLASPEQSKLVAKK